MKEIPVNRGRLLVGFVLIVLGVLFLLDQNDVLNSGDLIADWWPVVFVVAGLLYLSFSPRHIMVPAVLVILGLALLSRSLDFVPDWLETVFWPVVLVAIGSIPWLLSSGGRSLTNHSNSEAVRSSTCLEGPRSTSGRRDRLQKGRPWTSSWHLVVSRSRYPKVGEWK
jgi:hypothetical protein